MRVRVVSAVVLAASVAAAVVYAASASGGGSLPTCGRVSASGGVFNGLTGGQLIADVRIRNASQRECTVIGLPWIRLGPLRYPVKVVQAAAAILGSQAGDPGQVVRLRPGWSAIADIILTPGSCGLGKSEVYAFGARAGWARHGVAIGDLFCRNGTGAVWVGAFRFWSK